MFRYKDIVIHSSFKFFRRTS